VIRIAILGLAVALAACQRRASGPGGPVAADGRALYERYCAKCHGLDGQARTPAADSMLPRPAAFARGAFRHQTTPRSEPPSDADLQRVIRRGIPGTAMAPWPNFADAEVGALIREIRGFDPTSPAPSVLPADARADTKASPGSPPEAR
jgi:mono/diheme cytochrome c family protein